MLGQDEYCVLARCLTQKAKDLTFVGQHDLQIKDFNESNSYLLLMRSVSFYAFVKHFYIFKEFPV